MSWLASAFGKAKVWGYAILAGGLTIAAFLARIFFLKRQRDNLKDRAEVAEAQVTKAREIADHDNELESEYRPRRAEVRDEAKTGPVGELSDPNSGWLPDDSR